MWGKVDFFLSTTSFLKGTFIEAFGLYLIDKGHKVAVLAVDPSSSRSGGSILGDKTRMIHLSKHPQAYVRPSPSRGTLGGVGKHTQEAILLCEEAGYDVILVETVGVGQSETVVEGLVDMYTILVAPGVGDELQGIKKGTVELADMIIVNKADGAFADNATTTQYEYMSALRLLSPKPAFGWTPPVVKCSSVTLQGIPRVWELMSVYFNTAQTTGEFWRRRSQQNEGWMWRMIHEKLEMRFKESPSVQKSVPGVVEDLQNGLLTPYQASVSLLTIFDEEAVASRKKI